MFGGASEGDWSDVELDDVEVSMLAPVEPSSEGAAASSPPTSPPLATPHPSSSRKQASSRPPTSNSELPPAKRAKVTSNSSGSGVRSTTGVPSPHDVTMRDPKPGMFSREIPLAAREPLSRAAGSFTPTISKGILK